MMRVMTVIAIVILCLFVLTFVIYFFNLDMKLVRRVYDLLGKHYDRQDQDRKL